MATSNRVEGFFGSLKNLLEHKIVTLGNLVYAIYLRGERLRILSKSDKPTIIPQELMGKEDSKKLGTFASAMIFSEYMDLKLNGVLSIPYSETCCKNHTLYNLPCKHLILMRIKEDKNPLLTINDIPCRWIITNENKTDNPNTIERYLRPKNKENNWSYSNCIDKFERFFSLANRSLEIRNILDKALNDLCSLEHETGEDGDILPPEHIQISGAPSRYPRNNVDKAGAPKVKKKYRCSICGGDTHTAPRCPKNVLAT